MNDNKTNSALQRIARNEVKPYVDQTALFFDPVQYNHLLAITETFCRIEFLPSSFFMKRGNCMMLLCLAKSWNANPFMIAPSLYSPSKKESVQGMKLGIEAKVLIAVCNSSGIFKHPFEYSYDEDKSGKINSCTCKATLNDGTLREHTLHLSEVEQAGWLKDRASMPSPWKLHARMMFTYRTATQLIRIYFPEKLFGMYTKDEIKDISAIDITPEVQEVEPEPLSIETLIKKGKEKKESIDFNTGEVTEVKEEDLGDQEDQELNDLIFYIQELSDHPKLKKVNPESRQSFYDQLVLGFLSKIKKELLDLDKEELKKLIQILTKATKDN